MYIVACYFKEMYNRVIVKFEHTNECKGDNDGKG
jgi:hypothetical protein